MADRKEWINFDKAKGKFRPLRWLWQRLTRGFDDRDIYGLHYALTEFISPRVQYFARFEAEHGMSYPTDLDPASWLEILNKIALAFKLMEDDPHSDNPAIAEGLALFGKYYRNLWD